MSFRFGIVRNRDSKLLFLLFVFLNLQEILFFLFQHIYDPRCNPCFINPLVRLTLSCQRARENKLTLDFSYAIANAEKVIAESQDDARIMGKNEFVHRPVSLRACQEARSGSRAQNCLNTSTGARFLQESEVRCCLNESLLLILTVL